MSRLARPPYIDTTTGIAYDTDKAEFEGYLTKQSMWLRVRRIFYTCIYMLVVSNLTPSIAHINAHFRSLGLETEIFHSQGISIILCQDTV